MSNNPLWQPSVDDVANSQLSQFHRWAQQNGWVEYLTSTEQDGLTTAAQNYQRLYEWSITQPGEFWHAYWRFSEVVSSTSGHTHVEDLHKFPGAKWFPEARLNFAENLLQERSEKLAFIALLENGERRTCSYAQLFKDTQQISHHLRALNIKVGDRVAAWLPNIIEAATAMLATSSLGAVWSSCSPDFGAPGALDRFGQIEPKVLFACDGYYYAGKTIDITAKVREVASQVPSIEKIVWVPVIHADIECQANEALWQAWMQPLTTTPTDLETRGDKPDLFTQLPFDHPLYILYSSGTTGKPKCIVHGQGGTLLQHKKEQQLHLDLRAEDTLFFFTTCGWMMWNWLVSALASRCTIVLYDGSPFHPSPSTMFDICEQEQVNIFGISAKFLSGTQKENVRPVNSHDLSKMRMLISTGSPLTQEGFKYVYEDIKPSCHLVSMSGGTDLISCFMLGNPNLPVYEGELQSPGLGMAVEIWDDNGHPLNANESPGEKGELVCTVPFPSAPIGFWNDPNDEKYRAAYFSRFDNIWVHGDYAEVTQNGGYIIHGRSDAVLNPGGVRIGTAEIYRQVEQFEEIIDSVCVGQQWQDDVRVVLFVVMQPNHQLSDDLISRIKLQIRQFASPRHTPAKVIQVHDIPRTMSGKIAELAVRDMIHNREVKNTSALANPEALDNFVGLAELAT